MAYGGVERNGCLDFQITYEGWNVVDGMWLKECSQNVRNGMSLIDCGCWNVESGMPRMVGNA